ncbi:autotransporter [Ectopseudomonas composti]|uniref:Autotransporter n=1 Tax=Ectopseudomonas composti TaxID=658457 RepID=A0ABN0SC00_9GAMM|nr:autotransporter outer membrane beta-barrel domain-containing protein [Pseudomonas composti]EZH80367.1 autotransporter [Pseudomonas composti]
MKYNDAAFPLRHSLILSVAIAACIWGSDSARLASAQVTFTGNVNPTPPPGNDWVVGGDLAVGDAATGTLLIDAGGSVSGTADAYVGNLADGTVTVQGTDGSGAASSWTISGETNIGVETGSTGRLDILDGGVVSSDGGVSIGREDGSTGNVTVSGAGSLWDARSAANPSPSFQIGTRGIGTLDINAGGEVRSQQGLIGVIAGSNGRVTVNGPGSSWVPVDNIYIGFEGTGLLQVEDGAAVSTAQVGGGAATLYIGYRDGSDGTVSVSSTTGDVSTLSASDDLRVGVEGSGTISIDAGGLVQIADNVHIADTATSDGTLHLNGSAAGRGVLETGAVIAELGAVDLDLNGGILRANRNESNFLRNFTAGLAVGAEGAWFDSNGYNIGIGTAFSGTSTFNKLGAGTLTLTGNSSTFIGDALVQAGTLQVDGTLGGTMDVLAGARLTGIGQVGVTTNRGVIAPGQPGSLGTLTIAGDYTPAGGSIEIRTQLGDDSSPTDRLVITGATSGSTPVTVINVGGTGAQTTEGIKIIEVGGASNGVFTLASNTTYEGDPAVVAGAYAYRLYQGGVSTPLDGDWYLRSVIQNTSAPPGTPLYQPGVPSYEAYPQILLGLNGVPTLYQRVGNRPWEEGNAASSAEDASDRFTSPSGVWIRVEGGHNRVDPQRSTSGSEYRYDMAKTQVGLDALLLQNDGGNLVGGLSLHYVNGSADTKWRYGAGDYGSGDISTDGYGLGATLTWYGHDGFYVDGTAQATWYDSDLSARPVRGLVSDNDAFGYAFSLESGKRFTLDRGWIITPQAQVTYSKVRFDSFSDVFDASVRPGRDDSLQGRVGISLERQLDDTRLYTIANLYNEFLDGTSVRVDDQVFRSRDDRVRAGVGFGGSHDWDGGKYSLYGEGNFTRSLANSDSYGYGATLGFRVKW